MSEHTIPWATEYSITKDGHVFSSSNWRGYGKRELTQTLGRDGYKVVRLNIDGKRRQVYVHRLMAAMFLPQRPSPRHQLRHLDGDPFHNSADNLAWGTVQENAQDRVQHGRTYRPDWSDPEKRERWTQAIRRGRGLAVAQ